MEQYSFNRDSNQTAKKVYYYLVEVSFDAKITSDEILDGKWVEISKAKDLITYTASKEIANQVEAVDTLDEEGDMTKILLGRETKTILEELSKLPIKIYHKK